ncbi:MAG: LCP family protein [Actinomycetaceae bacterium]|nr:LCP family protein [Actinomycetaceae bacterium]MDY6083613.1 LCP family protein [Actinomycetaceae bacterium]
MARPARRVHPKRWILICIVLLLVLMMAWPVYLLFYGNSLLIHTDALSGRPDTPGTTYLIVGSDKRPAGSHDPAVGERSDSIMLLQVPESGSPALVSLPRDSWVTIPGHGHNKLNAAFALGGAPLLVTTVENLTGMTIDHYVQVSMLSLKSLVDAVGGVNLCLNMNVKDADSGLVWKSGCHDADGTQALAFSRMRKSDPTGDIGRTNRQRQVVSKVVSSAANPAVLMNPFKQRALVSAAATNLTTDTSTGMVDLGKAALSLKKTMGDGGLVGVPPIATINGRRGGLSVVVLADSAPQFFQKMKDGELSAADFGRIG